MGLEEIISKISSNFEILWLWLKELLYTGLRERNLHVKSSCIWFIDISIHQGLPGGSDGKGSVCNSGDLGLIPGLGRSPGEGHGNPLQYLAWRFPGTEEPGRLQSMGSPRVRWDWMTNTFTCLIYSVDHLLWFRHGPRHWCYRDACINCTLRVSELSMKAGCINKQKWQYRS